MKILSYDIESISGNHNDGSMCTFGYCIANENFEVLEQKDIVMRPNSRRYETKIKLHYEKSYIKAQPKFPEFYEQIKGLFASVDYVIGFSVFNDVEFLNNACAVYSLDKIEYEFIDVQLLYKRAYKKPNMSGLEKIAEELELEYLAHRSDEDARVTLLVLKHLCEKEGVTLKDLLRKYCITLGVNNNTETVPCTDGTYTKREKNHLILDFVEKNYQHNKKYKGGLSYKTFSFSDDIRYKDIDVFRRIIKKIYTLNGRISSIESSNVFVFDGKISDKEQASINVRNTGRERVKLMLYSDFISLIGELPEIDFSGDYEFIKEHRKQIKLQREEKRAEERKRRYLEKITQNNQDNNKKEN